MFFFSVHIAWNTTNSCRIEIKSSIETNNKKKHNKKTKRINKYTVSIFQCVCGWWSRSRARWQSPRVEWREERESVGLFVASCIVSSQIIKEKLIDVRQECSSTRLSLMHRRAAVHKLRAFFYDWPERGENGSKPDKGKYVFFYSAVSNCCFRLAKEYYIIIPSLPTLTDQTVVKINFHLGFVKNYEGVGRRASWLSERETSKLCEWLSGGTSVRSICSQGDESEQRAAVPRGHARPKAAKVNRWQQLIGKLMRLTNPTWTLVSLLYLFVDTEGKLQRAFVDLFCADVVFSYTVLAWEGVVEMSTYASVL